MGNKAAVDRLDEGFVTPDSALGRRLAATATPRRRRRPQGVEGDLKARMGGSIIGQEHVLERLLIGLLTAGNLLVEGLPGLAKTRAITALAQRGARPERVVCAIPTDVTRHDVAAYERARLDVRFDPLNADLARRNHGLAAVNREKYAAVGRLYGGPAILALLLGGLVVIVAAWTLRTGAQP
jgi:hypothetical protein